MYTAKLQACYCSTNDSATETDATKQILNTFVNGNCLTIPREADLAQLFGEPGTLRIVLLQDKEDDDEKAKFVLPSCNRNFSFSLQLVFDLRTLLAVDAIFVLNLAKRADRMTECRAEFDKWCVPTTQWTRFDACLGSDKAVQQQYGDAATKFLLAGQKPSELCNTAGALGCLLSHYCMIKEAKNRNLKRVLILEDDFEPTEHFGDTELLSKIGATQFDMLYLAMNVREPSTPTDDPDIVRAKFVLSTCAYIVSHTLYDFILDNCLQYAKPIDVFYAQVVQPKFNVLHSKRAIFVQRASKSDVAPGAT